MTKNAYLFAALGGSALAINILFRGGGSAEYMVLGGLNAALIAMIASFSGTRRAAILAMLVALAINFWVMEPILQFSLPTIPEYLMLAANMALAIYVPRLGFGPASLEISPPATIDRVRDCAAPMRNSHRKIAIQLCAQLPDGVTDSRLVLLAMQDVVDHYLDREKIIDVASNVLPFSQ